MLMMMAANNLVLVKEVISVNAYLGKWIIFLLLFNVGEATLSGPSLGTKEDFFGLVWTAFVNEPNFPM